MSRGEAQPETPLAGEPALAPLLCLLYRYWERGRYMLSASLTFPIPLALLEGAGFCGLRRADNPLELKPPLDNELPEQAKRPGTHRGTHATSPPGTAGTHDPPISSGFRVAMRL